ncbi:MAG: hypothetical protein ACYDCC_16525, partial [Actinomycetota bacterium]
SGTGNATNRSNPCYGAVICVAASGTGNATNTSYCYGAVSCVAVSATGNASNSEPDGSPCSTYVSQSPGLGCIAVTSITRATGGTNGDVACVSAVLLAAMGSMALVLFRHARNVS